MIRTTALGSIYLLMLFAFAAGIQALVGNDCSDWLTTCPDAQATTLETPDKDLQPKEPELH